MNKRRNFFREPSLIIIVLTIFFAVGSIVYFIIEEKNWESYTEFYMEHTSIDNSEEVVCHFGIVNHEYVLRNYTIVVIAGAETIWRSEQVSIVHGEKLDLKARLIKQEFKRQRIDVHLYIDEEHIPYRSLRLWI